MAQDKREPTDSSYIYCNAEAAKVSERHPVPDVASGWPLINPPEVYSPCSKVSNSVENDRGLSALNPMPPADLRPLFSGDWLLVTLE